MGAGCCSGGSKTATQVSPTHQRVPQVASGKPRFTDISVMTTDPLKLIAGYEKEPLVSLEEALSPFQKEIDQLAHHIQQAKKKCLHPSNRQLTHDQSAAIYIYTMRWGKKCVYDHLQDAWKAAERSKTKEPPVMKPWFKFLKLFKAGLDKLPDAKEEMWQATAYSEKDKELYTSDTQPLYISMGSCAPSEKELREHLGKDSTGRKIFIGYGLFVKGKVVTGYTASDIKEVFVFPGPKIGKAEVVVGPDGVVYIHFTRKYSE